MADIKNVVRKNSDALLNFLEKLNKKTVREIAVGFPKGKANAYPDGTSVIDVAAMNTFGIGVPQRDFMSFAKTKIVQDCEPLLKELASMEEGKGAEAIRNAIGQLGQAAIQDAITEGDYLPNAPATIAAKGEGKRPLIDSAHMIGAVTYVVRDRTVKRGVIF